MYKFFTVLVLIVGVFMTPTFLLADQHDNTVLLSILARNKAHLLPRYLENIDRLDYDKKLITVYINTNNNEDQTQELLEEWVEQHQQDYAAVIFEAHQIEDLPSTRPHEWTFNRFKVLGAIRNRSLAMAQEHHCDYYFVVDCDNFIAPCTLKALLRKKKPIIAPLLRAIPEPYDPYSNYFCAVTESGYYQDHPDYHRILYRQLCGTFAVPVVHCTYLIDSTYLDRLGYIDETNDYEFVIFSREARRQEIQQYICNEEEFGVLLHFYQDLTLEEEAARVEEFFSL